MEIFVSTTWDYKHGTPLFNISMYLLFDVYPVYLKYADNRSSTLIIDNCQVFIDDLLHHNKATKVHNIKAFTYCP